MSDYKFEAGKTYKLRGGGTAEILKVGIWGPHGETIAGLRTLKNGKQLTAVWHSSGQCFPHWKDDLDLLPPEPERVSIWVNVYPDKSVSTIIFDTREHADRSAGCSRTHVLELVYNEDGVFVEVIAHKVGE